MKKLAALILTVVSFYIKAQDTASILKNEIGFNTVALIKQVISNNPTSTLSQLPYAIFYNAYFDEKTGLRTGLGASLSDTKVSVTGQSNPRTTKSSGLNVRLGITHNFVKQGRLTLNAFADGILANSKTKTVNTSTTQVFPNPVQTITSESTTNVGGYGAQVGVGLKFNLYKHLSIYAEVPISFINQTSNSEDKISGPTPENEKTTSKTSELKITLPTTLYLVLMF